MSQPSRAAGSTRSRRARHPERSRRTTLNLPEELLREARTALGTTGVRDTVVRAMEESVQLRLRLRLLQRDLPDLTPDLVERLRQPTMTSPGEKDA